MGAFTLAAGQAAINGVSTAFNQGLNMLTYNRQRRDALSDWQRDAEYNKPLNQVKRLQEAGISPYAQSGQSLLATAPQTRAAQMGNSQPTKVIDLLQIRQAAARA